MAQMILTYDNITVIAEKTGEIIISVNIFHHTMNDLDNAQICPLVWKPAVAVDLMYTIAGFIVKILFNGHYPTSKK